RGAEPAALELELASAWPRAPVLADIARLAEVDRRERRLVALDPEPRGELVDERLVLGKAVHRGRIDRGVVHGDRGADIAVDPGVLGVDHRRQVAKVRRTAPC